MKKKTIIKIILDILLCLLFSFILFICVNIVIWCFKYWWILKYFDVINKKSRKESVQNVSMNPVSWFWFFYVDQNNIDQDPVVLDMFQQIDEVLNENNNWENYLWELDFDQQSWEDSNSMFGLDDENIEQIYSWEQKIENNNPYDPDFEDEFNRFFAWN